MTVDVDYDVDWEDIGSPEGLIDGSPFYIKSLWIDEDTNEITGGRLQYTWDCGAGCCSGTSDTEWYPCELSEGTKAYILSLHPKYKFKE